MMTAIRLLLVGVVVGLLIVAGLLTYVATHADQVVRTFVEVEGSQTLGAAITVRDVDVRLRDARASLHGIEIGNPPGFHVHGQRAIAIDTIEVELDPGRSDAAKLVLQRVVAHGIVIDAVVRGPDDSNLHAMLRGLEYARIRAEAATGGERDERRYAVGQVVLVDIEVDAIAELSRRQISAVLPDVHLVDLGDSQRGTEIEGLLHAVIAPLAAAVGEVAAQHGLDGRRPSRMYEAAR